MRLFYGNGQIRPARKPTGSLPVRGGFRLTQSASPGRRRGKVAILGEPAEAFRNSGQPEASPEAIPARGQPKLKILGSTGPVVTRTRCVLLARRVGRFSERRLAGPPAAIARRRGMAPERSSH